MAECPDCHTVWLWDWCNDVYVDQKGEQFETVEMADNAMHEVLLVKCNCRRVNAVLIGCECGAGPANILEWKDVDWEADENGL